MENFKHWQIGEDTYAIQCPGLSFGPGKIPGWGYAVCYLLIGQEKALLQDTGYGNADLKGYVERLTDKPLIVVNSHAHQDHVGGNAQFGEIFVLEGEVNSPEPVYFDLTGEEGRCQLVRSCPPYRFTAVPEGHVFDLGDRLVEVHRLGGHSRGSMALFDRKTGYLFSGDALLKRVFLFAGESLSQYRQRLLAVAEACPIRDIYGCHWHSPLGAAQLHRMVALIDEFLAGHFGPGNTDSHRFEIVPWSPGAAVKMVLYAHGNAFEEEDFCCFGFPEPMWEKINR